MVVEVTVVLKDSERSYRQKFLCYDTLCIEPKEIPCIDGNLFSYIEQAKKNFQGEPEDIELKITYVYQ
jgi:hypothetical protein